MSANKQLIKKVFLAISTVVVAVACVVYLVVIFDAFEYQQEMAERKIGDEIITIHKGVPRGWGYTIETDPEKVGGVGTLGKALAQVNFSLPDLNRELGGKILQRSIYFYPEAMFDKISAELERTKATEAATCKPEYYSRTHDYVILTDSCSGFKKQEYQEFERQLKSELEEFWFRFQ